MNKAELVTAMATETGLSKKDVESVLNSFVNVVSDELAKKEKELLELVETHKLEKKSKLKKQQLLLLKLEQLLKIKIINKKTVL